MRFLTEPFTPLSESFFYDIWKFILEYVFKYATKLHTTDQLGVSRIFTFLFYNKSHAHQQNKAKLTGSSVSHDPSGIILICWFDTQETFVIIIINVENRCAT